MLTFEATANPLEGPTRLREDLDRATTLPDGEPFEKPRKSNPFQRRTTMKIRRNKYLTPGCRPTDANRRLRAGWARGWFPALRPRQPPRRWRREPRRGAAELLVRGGPALRRHGGGPGGIVRPLPGLAGPCRHRLHGHPGETRRSWWVTSPDHRSGVQTGWYQRDFRCRGQRRRASGRAELITIVFPFPPEDHELVCELADGSAGPRSLRWPAAGRGRSDHSAHPAAASVRDRNLVPQPTVESAFLSRLLARG